MRTQIEVERANLNVSRLRSAPSPDLADGQVLAHVDSFALTANNVTYGVAGDMIGYWKFFPAEGDWGVIPVWGFATVTRSRCADIPVGERIWGFLPMASEVVLEPGQVTRGAFVDLTAHRQALPGLYNRYQRTTGEPAELAALEVERCALFPLFTTSFVIADMLADSDWFGARQVLVLSASSKTGFGLANLLSRVDGHPVDVIGVTSPANREFVEGLGVCDRTITYEEVASLDPNVPTILVDMAGSARVLTSVHTHFGDALVYSCGVGITHWTEGGSPGDLPGAKPAFFFAPGQIAKREAEWGPGEALRRAQAEGARIAREMAGVLSVERISGAEAARSALAEMVAGRVSPSRVLMLSID
jgi:hypothetical protein